MARKPSVMSVAKKMYRPDGAKSVNGMHRPEGAGNFDNMDDYNIVQSIACNTGTIQGIPANNKDIVNKEYVDSEDAAADAHITSDGTSHSHVVLNDAHRADNTQAHTDYLINNGNDTTTGILTATGFTTTGDVIANSQVLVGDLSSNPLLYGLEIGGDSSGVWIQRSFDTDPGSGRAPFCAMQRTRGTPSSPAAVTNGIQLGKFNFGGYTPSATYATACAIEGVVNGSPSTIYVPGELLFKTAPVGGTIATRMDIKSTGLIGVNTLNPAYQLDVNGTFGVTGTSSLGNINSTGDLVFINANTGLNFSEIYYTGAGADTTLAAQDTWYQILGFNTNGLYNGSAPDHTNDHIQIGVTGNYKIFFSVSSRSAATNTFQFMVRKNNGATDATNVKTYRVTTTAGRMETSACEGYVNCTVGDTIELWVKRTDGGAVSSTITAEHLNLNVMQVGG